VALAVRRASNQLSLMIIYEVTTTVATDAVPAYEAFMRERHILDVLATGCFVSASIACSLPGRYRICYVARDLDILDAYLATHASHLRSDLARHLGDKVEVSREVWTELQTWQAGSDRPTT